MNLIPPIEELTEKMKYFKLKPMEFVDLERLGLISEEFQRLANRSRDMIYHYDLRTRCFIFINKAILEFYGLDSVSLLTESNQSLLIHIFPKDVEKIKTAWKESLLPEHMQGEVAYRLIKPDGNQFWMHDTWIIIPDKTGNPAIVEGIIRDITETMKKEEKLRQTEEKFSRVFHNSPLGVTLSSVSTGNYLEVSDRYCKISGFTREELIGKSTFDINIWYDPNDPHRLREILAKHGMVTDFDFRFKRKNGEIGWATLSASVLDIDGEKCICAQAMDITPRKLAEMALKQSEEHYRGIIENILDAYYRCDNHGKLIMFSPSGVELFGYDSENELIGRPITDFYIDPRERSKFLLMLQKTGIVRDYEVILKHKDGSPIDIAASSRYYYNESGEIQGIEGILRDIRDRKQAEKEKKELEDRLNRAEKMEALGLLAGGVAHDVNNVLGIIVGNAELTLDEVDHSSPFKQRLEAIMNGGMQAAAIVADLLTLARRNVTDRKVVNINDIINNNMNSPVFMSLFSHHDAVKVETHLEPDLLNISGSSVHLTKALFNLLSNAMEAMSIDGVLTIKTTNQYLDKPVEGYDQIREGDYVVLSVSDTGEGIHKDDLKRIFEPFYTKKTMGRSGTGLGLAVIWGTVKDHNGYINVQSEQERGSVFTLYFPVTREDIFIKETGNLVSRYKGHGESILVVDDVKAQCDLAVEMLRRLNYKVASVSSGEDALAYIKDHHADLLVLDMIMEPGMDGLDTYKEILKIRPEQKAVIVSGFSETDRVHAAQALGAGAYLRKPYIMEKLGVTVRKELEKTAAG